MTDKELKEKYCCRCINNDCNFDCIAKQEDDKTQQKKQRSYSRFEKCIILLLAKFFSKEKDINKFGEWLEKYLKKGDD